MDPKDHLHHQGRISMRRGGSVLLPAVVVLCVACGDGTQPAATVTLNPESIKSFEGVQSVERSKNGFWLVGWNPLPDDQTVYSVFKSPQGNALDFESPFTTTEGSSYLYRPSVRYGGGSLCFAVRIANLPGDKNTKSLCTQDEPLVFAGAESLTRLADGSYMLSWQKVAVDNVVYAIYERNKTDEFTFAEASYDGIQNNFFSQLNPVERGTQYCYVVRYSHPDLPPDTNTKELCTQWEDPISFSGITDLVSVGPGSIKATWEKADANVVTSYRIYQGSDFRELVSTAQGHVNEATLSGLVPGRQYNIGVRAVDIYQREDRNIRIRAIVVPFP